LLIELPGFKCSTNAAQREEKDSALAVAVRHVTRGCLIPNAVDQTSPGRCQCELVCVGWPTVRAPAWNLDPLANGEPDRFDTSRAEPRAFTFGLGVHECPARMLATFIAQAGVERLHAGGLDPGRLNRQQAQRSSWHCVQIVRSD